MEGGAGEEEGPAYAEGAVGVDGEECLTVVFGVLVVFVFVLVALIGFVRGRDVSSFEDDVDAIVIGSVISIVKFLKRFDFPRQVGQNRKGNQRCGRSVVFAVDGHSQNDRGENGGKPDDEEGRDGERAEKGFDGSGRSWIGGKDGDGVVGLCFGRLAVGFGRLPCGSHGGRFGSCHEVLGQYGQCNGCLELVQLN